MPNAQEQFAAAVKVANIPTLLMVLVQMTGQQRWLESPYRPSRGTGLGDHDTGGLPEEIQDEIRAAALIAINRWYAGEPLAMPAPDNDTLVKMLSVAMGEPVPEAYGEFTQSLFGFRPMTPKKLDLPDGFSAIIIGAGVSGICAAVNFKAAGIPFTILEKNSEVGGVWLENRYPGAGVDTPNHLYSYSFSKYDWSMFFALRDELHEYLQSIANEHDLAPHIRFKTRVNEARYDEGTQTWTVDATDPQGRSTSLVANVVISACGIFNPPVKPNIKGLDDFAGPAFHSAEWPKDLSLEGKRVAIIGNGASCMQIGPEIQNQVKALTIFQRSAHWAAPFEQFRREVSAALRFLIKEVPLYQAWYRTRLAWTFNDKVHESLQRDPDWEHSDRSLNAINDQHRAYFTQYIKRELGERIDLLDKVLPTYPPFGKRMLLDNGWYRMLRNERVTLIDDTITEIDGSMVVTDTGDRFEADILIIATGFDVLRFINTYEVAGRGGKKLRDAWEDDNAQAYLGTVVPEFPNFFTLYGPNLQPGHGGSLVVVVEMQMNYIMDLIAKMVDGNIGAVECRRDVHDEYIARCDSAHENMVWAHRGMTTYYRNDRGRIVVNSPFKNVDYFSWTRRASLSDFETEPRRKQS
ncbi:MAG: NAD(P)/FAD-dependent oxidoreductase [Pseudomonadota bacterium]